MTGMTDHCPQQRELDVMPGLPRTPEIHSGMTPELATAGTLKHFKHTRVHVLNTKVFMSGSQKPLKR
eukprot:999212-Amphidinium_carterae.1